MDILASTAQTALAEQHSRPAGYASDDDTTKRARRRTWFSPQWCHTMVSAAPAPGNIVLGKGQKGPLRFQITTTPRRTVDPSWLRKKHTERVLTANATRQSERARCPKRRPHTNKSISRLFVCHHVRTRVDMVMSCSSCFTRMVRAERDAQRTRASTVIQPAPPTYAMGLNHMPYALGDIDQHEQPSVEFAPHCAGCTCGDIDAVTRLNRHLARQNARYAWCTAAAQSFHRPLREIPTLAQHATPSDDQQRMEARSKPAAIQHNS